jgi:hypothetical protein
MVAITALFFWENLAALFSEDSDCSAFEQAEIRFLDNDAAGSEFGLLRRNHEVFPLQFPEC